jgi:hypothetical protein
LLTLLPGVHGYATVQAARPGHELWDDDRAAHSCPYRFRGPICLRSSPTARMSGERLLAADDISGNGGVCRDGPGWHPERSKRQTVDSGTGRIPSQSATNVPVTRNNRRVGGWGCTARPAQGPGHEVDELVYCAVDFGT